jgi:hypothetical protein
MPVAPPFSDKGAGSPSNSFWQDRFTYEMKTAVQARTAGNEGMARVCARRAAGIIVAEYFRRRGLEWKSASAYDALRILRTLPDISEKSMQAADHLLVRLTPEHTLPVEADLLAEARWLAAELLGEQP